VRRIHGSGAHRQRAGGVPRQRALRIDVGGLAVVIGGGEELELPAAGGEQSASDFAGFELRMNGAFLCKDGPARARGEAYSNKKLCFTATSQELLARHLRRLSERDDCFFVKFSVRARGGMYLGRCFLTSDGAVGEAWALYKNHPSLFCTIQDDDFTASFRERSELESPWLDPDRLRPSR
jgi:hypothetical protein